MGDIGTVRLRLAQAVVKIADRGLKGLSYLPQTGRPQTVGTTFVFLNLLKPYPDLHGQLLLGQA